MENQKFSSHFITITYLIYIIFWETLVIGGCAYIVFGLHYSGWWFILAVALSQAAYRPKQWYSLLNGEEEQKQSLIDKIDEQRKAKNRTTL
jgi:hypothetical protein